MRIRTLSFLYLSFILIIAGLIASCNNDIGLPDPGDTDTDPPVPGAAIFFPIIDAMSLTVSWGAATDPDSDPDSLEYKLVKAPELMNGSAIDTIDEANAMIEDNLIMDWASDTSMDIIDLDPNTEYYFAVLVKDGDENYALYEPKSVFTKDDSTAPPEPGAGIFFTHVGLTTLTVSWGAATDPDTDPELLQYKLVKAVGENGWEEIDSLEEVRDLSGDNLIMDWTANDTSEDVTDLTGQTEYYFAVIVRDAEKMALYDPEYVFTEDNSTAPPEAGTDITFTNIGLMSLRVSWGAATDPDTDSELLEYKLVKAPDLEDYTSIDSVEAANAMSGNNLIMDWSANALSKDVSDLIEDMEYFFAVIVKDNTGNYDIYSPQSIQTEGPPFYDIGIEYENVSSTSLTITWGIAADSITPQEELRYKVVKVLGTNDGEDIDDIEEANAITTSPGLVRDWTNGITFVDGIGSLVVTGLAPATEYYFAVLVQDGTGNMDLYDPLDIETTE